MPPGKSDALNGSEKVITASVPRGTLPSCWAGDA